jgi:hypothetical protein
MRQNRMDKRYKFLWSFIIIMNQVKLFLLIQMLNDYDIEFIHNFPFCEI